MNPFEDLILPGAECARPLSDEPPMPRLASDEPLLVGTLPVLLDGRRHDLDVKVSIGDTWHLELGAYDFDARATARFIKLASLIGELFFRAPAARQVLDLGVPCEGETPP